jgi:transposase
MKNKKDVSPNTNEYASFLRVKNIKGNLYLYEVTPSYNTETKKRSQKSKYIRKVLQHEDIENITRDPLPLPFEPPKLKEIKAFGDAYVFNSIVEEIGLRKVLLKCFLEEDTNFLLLLTAYRLLCGGSLCHLSSWMETSDLLHFYPYEKSLSSQSISKTLKRIGFNAEEDIANFFMHWIQTINREGESLLFDITSFTSQANKMEVLEYGYAKDHKPYPQLNMGLLVNQDQHLPMYYKLYPGSLKDVTLLSHMVEEAKLFGVSSVKLILDRGFYSKYNLNHMHQSDYSFLLPLPRTSKKLYKSIMIARREELDSPTSLCLLKGKPIYAVGGCTKINNKSVVKNNENISSYSLYYGLYLDPKRQSQEQNNFLIELLMAEKTLQDLDLSIYSSKQEIVKDIGNKWTKYFIIEEEPTNEIKIQRNSETIQEKLDSMGIFILISSTKQDLKLMLTQYRQRDEVEKVFDAGKNELFGNVLRVHTNETMESTMFILFLSLIIQTCVGSKMKKGKVDSKYSIQSLFFELHKLKKAIWQGKICLINEITKAQRILFEQLQIVLPNS